MSDNKTILNFSAEDWNMFSITTSNYNKDAISLFKNCIGRVYNPNSKCWWFPNRSYEYLLKMISNCEELEIGMYLPASALTKIQIIINKEDGKNFYVQTPFDSTLVDLFNNLNGFFIPETKLWCFQSENRENFDTTVNSKGYEIKYEKDRPKSTLNNYY